MNDDQNVSVDSTGGRIYRHLGEGLQDRGSDLEQPGMHEEYPELFPDDMQQRLSVIALVYKPVGVFSRQLGLTEGEAILHRQEVFRGLPERDQRIYALKQLSHEYSDLASSFGRSLTLEEIEATLKSYLVTFRGERHV